MTVVQSASADGNECGTCKQVVSELQALVRNSDVQVLNSYSAAASVIFQKTESHLYSPGSSSSSQWHVSAGGLTPNLRFPWGSGTTSNTVCH